jgi:hypothetical protein
MLQSYRNSDGRTTEMHADRWLPCQKNIVRPDNRLLRLLDEDTYKNLLPISKY